MRDGEMSIMDVAPTALELFGIIPAYKDGKSLLKKASA
jgi:predicted AlkP superfamily phosphohydrolase/phosphomutase